MEFGEIVRAELRPCAKAQVRPELTNSVGVVRNWMAIGGRFAFGVHAGEEQFVLARGQEPVPGADPLGYFAECDLRVV